jgi:hypothetical protein
MRLEYLIMTTKGPVVGTENVNDQAAACDALEAAVRAAFGRAYSEAHERAVRRLCAQLRASGVPFSFQVPAVSVTLMP